jgi:hypothetical protein
MRNWFREIDDIFRNGISEEHRIFATRYARKAKQHIDKAMKGFDQEAKETREMAQSFYRLLEHKLDLNERTDPPSREEVIAAVEQLKDVGRYSVFVTAVILPGGVISLVGLELLARRYGIDFSLIPSAFRKQKKADPGAEQSSIKQELPASAPTRDPPEFQEPLT